MRLMWGRVKGGEEGLGMASGWLELLLKHVRQSGIVDSPTPSCMTGMTQIHRNSNFNLELMDQ